MRDWLQERLRHRLNAPEHLIFEIQLAAHEAAANVILHSECSDTRARIDIELGITEESLQVEMLYEGSEFRCGRVSPPTLSGSGERFGLFIIQECADRVEYGSCAPGRNFIRLTKFHHAKRGCR